MITIEIYMHMMHHIRFQRNRDSKRTELWEKIFSELKLSLDPQVRLRSLLIPNYAQSPPNVINNLISERAFITIFIGEGPCITFPPNRVYACTKSQSTHNGIQALSFPARGRYPPRHATHSSPHTDTTWCLDSGASHHPLLSQMLNHMGVRTLS